MCRSQLDYSYRHRVEIEVAVSGEHVRLVSKRSAPGTLIVSGCGTVSSSIRSGQATISRVGEDDGSFRLRPFSGARRRKKQTRARGCEDLLLAMREHVREPTRGGGGVYSEYARTPLDKNASSQNTPSTDSALDQGATRKTHSSACCAYLKNLLDQA